MHKKKKKIKKKKISFAFDVLFSDWNIIEIIRYFAFVNQVASIRKVSTIETQAIQHFVFSGKNAVMSVEERILMNAWWNFTLVSCVANISAYFPFPIFDSMVYLLFVCLCVCFYVCCNVH